MKHSFDVDFPASTARNISYTSTLFPPFFQLNRCGLRSFRAGFRDSRFSVPKSHVGSRVFPSQQEGCCCFFFAIHNKNRKFQVLSLENKPSYWPDSVCPTLSSYWNNMEDNNIQWLLCFSKVYTIGKMI